MKIIERQYWAAVAIESQISSQKAAAEAAAIMQPGKSLSQSEIQQACFWQAEAASAHMQAAAAMRVVGKIHDQP